MKYMFCSAAARNQLTVCFLPWPPPPLPACLRPHQFLSVDVNELI